MTSDDDHLTAQLRPLLEKIAATAGDPPEHGLERVAMLRRRRKRHRRGAVAAAMALAVSGVAAAPWLAGLTDQDHDVTAAAETDDGRSPPPEVPDLLQMRCSADGIDVPVASIRPQTDGMHIAVENDLRIPVAIRVTSDEWDSGEIIVEPGETNLRQPVPPGVLTVGCQVGGVDERRRVDLVDTESLYTVPELACDVDARQELTDLPIAEPTRSYAGAVNQALEGFLADDDEVRPLDGYPDQGFTDPTVDPTVRVVRGGEAVAFVHLSGVTDDAVGDDDGSQPGVWSSVPLVEACSDFLLEPAPDSETSPNEPNENDEG